MGLDPRDFDQKRGITTSFLEGVKTVHLGKFSPVKDTFKAVLAILEKGHIFTGILTIFFLEAKKKFNGYPRKIPVEKYAILRGFRCLV